MTANVQRVLDLGNDVLEVTGTVDGVDGPDGSPMLFVVNGWVSAMTNHYGPEQYGDDGHLVDGAKPRQMTPDERMAYWQSLLTNAAPAQGPSSPAVLFEAPTTDAGGGSDAG